jgi:hypothetical protein
MHAKGEHLKEQDNRRLLEPLRASLDFMQHEVMGGAFRGSYSHAIMQVHPVISSRLSVVCVCVCVCAFVRLCVRACDSSEQRVAKDK